MKDDDDDDEVLEDKMVQFNMRVSEGLLIHLDNIRRADPQLPSRAEMVRKLITNKRVKDTLFYAVWEPHKVKVV